MQVRHLSPSEPAPQASWLVSRGTGAKGKSLLNYCLPSKFLLWPGQWPTPQNSPGLLSACSESTLGIDPCPTHGSYGHGRSCSNHLQPQAPPQPLCPHPAHPTPLDGLRPAPLSGPHPLSLSSPQAQRTPRGSSSVSTRLPHPFSSHREVSPSISHWVFIHNPLRQAKKAKRKILSDFSPPYNE